MRVTHPVSCPERLWVSCRKVYQNRYTYQVANEQGRTRVRHSARAGESLRDQLDRLVQVRAAEREWGIEKGMLSLFIRNPFIQLRLLGITQAFSTCLGMFSNGETGLAPFRQQFIGGRYD